VRLIAVVVVTASGAWAIGVMYFAGPGDADTRAALTLAVGALALLTIVLLFLRRRAVTALTTYIVVLGAVSVWWAGIKPSNERHWEPDVAVLAHATIEGDRVTVHNIRNFEYRTETDYTPAYYDRTFDMNKLDRVDLVSVYWMGPAIAHVFVTFGFGADHLAISIEARKELGEGYSTLGGFFRQYELIYVVADERDVIRLRTNYRHDPPEDVYVYPLQAPIENGRRLFLEYMRAINALAREPQFYNTLTSNCTNAILVHTSVNPGHPPYSWKILLSGYTAEYAYDLGKLDRRFPFEDLKRLSRVNDAAQAASESPEFSRLIRAGLPDARQ
jgi:hypothetical protein